MNLTRFRIADKVQIVKDELYKISTLRNDQGYKPTYEALNKIHKNTWAACYRQVSTIGDQLKFQTLIDFKTKKFKPQ